MYVVTDSFLHECIAFIPARYRVSMGAFMRHFVLRACQILERSSERNGRAARFLQTLTFVRLQFLTGARRAV